MARLIPNYDEYFIGFKDRTAILEVAKRSNVPSAALFAHVIVLDGQIVGRWKRVLEKRAVVVELRPFSRLTTAQRRAVAGKVARYGNFLERPVELTWSRASAL